MTATEWTSRPPSMYHLSYYVCLNSHNHLMVHLEIAPAPDRIVGAEEHEVRVSSTVTSEP